MLAGEDRVDGRVDLLGDAARLVDDDERRLRVEPLKAVRVVVGRREA